MEYEPEIYKLPGADVEVHKPFGNEYYYALVKLDGRYPEPGQIAHDIGRQEYIQLLEGNAELTVNDIQYVLQPMLGRLINDGDFYFLQGKADLMVFVEDKINGSTQIENIKLG